MFVLCLMPLFCLVCYLLYPHSAFESLFFSGSVWYGEPTLTNVTFASSKAFLALTLVLIWFCVGAGPAVFTRLVGATIVQIWNHKKISLKPTSVFCSKHNNADKLSL